MADFPLGQPVPVGIRITSPLTGAPVTAGITTTYSIYGPTSATALVAGVSAANLGDGIWGGAAVGPYSTPGEYRFVLAGFSATVDGSSRTWGAQEYAFSVGTPGQGATTLLGLLAALCLPLDDGWQGITTAAGVVGAGTGTLVDGNLINASGVADDYAGTELLPLQYTALPLTTARGMPYRVTAFAPSTGTLTFLPQPAALIASGVDYLACNVNGAGFGVAERLRALRAAFRLGGATRRASVEVGLAAVDSVDEYALPQQLVSVTAVYARDSGGQADRWTRVGADRWRRMLRADRRLLTLGGYAAGTVFRVDGHARAVFPPFLGQYVDGPVEWYVARAAADLLKASPETARQRMAGPLFQEALATRPRRTPDANEVILG